MPAFPYHRQNDGQKCGPACLQMMIEGLGGDPGAGSPADKFHQTTLYSRAHLTEDKPKSAWASAPDGMLTAANAMQVEGGIAVADRLRYRLRAFTASSGSGAGEAAEAALATVRASVTSGHPAFLLANGGLHWLLACGTVGSLIEVRDPLPVGTRGDRHRRHTPPGPSCCRTPSASLRGPVFTGLDFRDAPNSRGTLWRGKHVVLAPAGAQAAMAPVSPPPPSPGAPAPSPGTIVEVGSALEAADAHLREVSAGSAEWKGWLAGLSPTAPLLAERIEGGPPPPRYFIVPFRDTFDTVRALVNIDAADGQLYEIRIVPDGSAPWWPEAQLSQAGVLHAAEGKPFNPPGSGSLPQVFDPVGASVLLWETGPFAGQPKLVWRCCAQSLTPFQPFYQLVSAEGVTLWLGVNRRLQTVLRVSKGGL